MRCRRAPMKEPEQGRPMGRHARGSATPRSLRQGNTSTPAPAGRGVVVRETRTNDGSCRRPGDEIRVHVHRVEEEKEVRTPPAEHDCVEHLALPSNSSCSARSPGGCYRSWRARPRGLDLCENSKRAGRRGDGTFAPVSARRDLRDEVRHERGLLVPCVAVPSIAAGSGPRRGSVAAPSSEGGDVTNSVGPWSRAPPPAGLREEFRRVRSADRKGCRGEVAPGPRSRRSASSSPLRPVDERSPRSSSGRGSPADVPVRSAAPSWL